MYRGHTVGVVVPAHDEDDTVADVLTDQPEFVDVVYAVDDCSTDDTAEEVRRVADGGRAPRLELSQHVQNRGAGAAIATGYRRARGDGVDLAVTMDADGQMNAAWMDELLDPLVDGEGDFAKGDRLATEAHRDEMPPVRLTGNLVLTELTRFASGYSGVSDPQNGYTAITGEALAALDLDRLPDTHAYCNDLLVQLAELDAEVVDVPMPAIYGEESSSINFARFVVAALRVLGVDYVRRRHPSRGLDRSVDAGRDRDSGTGPQSRQRL